MPNQQPISTDRSIQENNPNQQATRVNQLLSNRLKAIAIALKLNPWLVPTIILVHFPQVFAGWTVVLDKTISNPSHQPSIVAPSVPQPIDKDDRERKLKGSTPTK